VSGWFSTAAGMVLCAFPPTIPGGIAMLVAEAAFIVTSHALYAAAYDPDVDYKAAVQLRPIRTNVLAEIKDVKARKQAQAALDMAAQAKALTEAYTKHLGAAAKRDAIWAKKHGLAAASFAKGLVKSAQTLAPMMKQAADAIRKAKPEALAAAKKSLAAGELPDVEVRVLRDAGFSDKQIRDAAKVNPKGLDELLKRPQLAAVAHSRLISALNRFAAEVAKAPGKTTTKGKN